MLAVLERYGHSVQAEPVSRDVAGVGHIAEQRVAEMRHVDPELVPASGPREQPDQRGLTKQTRRRRRKKKRRDGTIDDEAQGGGGSHVTASPSVTLDIATSWPAIKPKPKPASTPWRRIAGPAV